MDKSAWMYLLFFSVLVSTAFFTQQIHSFKKKWMYVAQVILALLFEIAIEYIFPGSAILELICFVWLGVNIFIQYVYILTRFRTHHSNAEQDQSGANKP